MHYYSLKVSPKQSFNGRVKSRRSTRNVKHSNICVCSRLDGQIAILLQLVHCIDQARYQFSINASVYYYNTGAYDISEITFAKVCRFVLLRNSNYYGSEPETATRHHTLLLRNVIAINSHCCQTHVIVLFNILLFFPPSRPIHEIRLLGRLISLSRIRVELNNGIGTNRIKIQSKSYELRICCK